MKKTEVEKTNQEFSPSSHKLNVKTTTFKEKFTSRQPLGWGRMALAGPPPALLILEITQVSLPCPGGLAAMLTSRQGLGISFSMAPHPRFSLLLTRLKLIWWPWGLLLPFFQPLNVCVTLFPPSPAGYPTKSHPSCPEELLHPSLSSFCRSQPPQPSTIYLCSCT